MSIVDRRDFLKLVGAGGVGAGAGFMLAESIKHPVEHLVPYPVPPEEYSPGVATWYNTVCSMCAAGCGISVRIREGRAKKIEGNPAHPVNQGRVCAVGQAGLQVLYNPDRLTTPLLRADRDSDFVPTTWDAGLARVTGSVNSLRANGNGASICLLSEGVRGHLAGLFELFMEQLGSQRLVHYDFDHPDTLYAAHERLFGEQQLPYYDLSNSQYLLSFGADFLGSWISPVHHGLGFGRMREGERGRLVQIEPRMSLSGAAADEWIPAKPGTEGLLALGLAHHIVAEGHYQGADKDNWTLALDAYDSASVAEATGVPAATITRLAESFASAEPGLAIGGGAVANHSNGVAALTAVNALNYLVGNLGQAGGLIFNPAPSGPTSHPRQANYRSMVELAEDARQGRIQVLILNKTNPVFNLPAAADFKEALSNIPLIVSLSSFMDETTALADVILPSHTYLESWGDDIPEPAVGFPVGTVSQPVVAPFYNTKPTGDIILAIAQGVGLAEALPWTSMEEYLKQGWQAIHGRGQAETATESFETFWRALLQAGVSGENVHREQESVALTPGVVENIAVAGPQFAGSADAYPFVLHPYISTTLQDGRGANLPWMQELPDPMTSIVYGSWVELNPVTAGELGLEEGDLVEVESPAGRISAPVFVYPGIRPDVVAMPIGQGHEDYGRYAQNRGANPIAILAPEMESVTGSLAWSATRVNLVPTGKKIEILKTSGTSRDLGRGIVQTTGSDGGDDHAGLNSIPITVVST